MFSIKQVLQELSNLLSEPMLPEQCLDEVDKSFYHTFYVPDFVEVGHTYR